MRIATAHKGKSACPCTVQGQAAHSSQNHLGVNAINYAAERVLFLRNQGRLWRGGAVTPGRRPGWGRPSHL
ncbi:peptidase dimerization domain-containing protein [Raoultella planticola]|uniref:peptidase dimerization domain-containing protein n=1 Tax=Raoultella planticola TaxID=575 RepID=UPI003524B7FD